MNLEEKVLERYRADETFRSFINTYYHSYDLAKPVIHTPTELAQFFGGVLKVYLDCCTDLTSLELPAKLEQLVTYINTHQPIPDKLIQYASSPNLWVGMTFSSHDISIAIEKGCLGYLKWRATWDKDIYKDVQDMFDIALIYDQAEVAEWLLDNHTLLIFDEIYQNIIERDCINVFKLLYQRELIVINNSHTDNYYWNRLKCVPKRQILRDCVSRDAIKIGTYIIPLIDISQDDIKNVIRLLSH